MTQRQVNDRRAWKAETFNFDYYMGTPGRSCTVCLTDKQRELLLGILEPVGWRTRWWSDMGTVIDTDKTEAFRDDISRRLIMACCGDEEPILFIYDEDGNLERSDDGGVTYYPAPVFDIRVNPVVSFPPPVIPEGEDLTCQLADSAVVLIKEQIGDQLTDDMSRYTLQQLISDWTKTVIGTSNPFQALLLVVTNQIFALLISAVRAALTDDVYDRLRCIFQSHMNSTGFFDGTAWEGVRSDILSQITGIGGVFLEHLVYLIGNGGLSNLARAGAGSADAVCCPECSPDVWFTTILDGEAVGSIIEVGFNYVIVQSVAHHSFGGLTGEISIETTADDQCCLITGVTYSTGESFGDMQHFDVDCPNPRYPASSLTGWDGTNSSNSFQIRKPLGATPTGTQFQAKIFFA